jgi:hypothetical protein
MLASRYEKSADNGGRMTFCCQLRQASYHVGFVDIIIQWPVRPHFADARYPARSEHRPQSHTIGDITPLGLSWPTQPK